MIQPAKRAATAAAILLLAFAALGRPARAADETPSTAGAADPRWPLQLDFDPGPLGKIKSKPVLAVWTPPEARRIRGVFLVVINSDSKNFLEHPALRDVLKKHEIGIVYSRAPFQYNLRDGKDPEVIQRALDAVADKTGIVEFRHAPLITLGKSASGAFPFWTAWAFPKRTIADISYHAETPTWPVAHWARLGGETICHLSINGEEVWGGTWYRHVRPSLLNYREHKGWLAHQVVTRGVGHGNYPDAHGSPGWGKPFPDRVTCIRVWDYAALYLDKVLGARLPKGKYPTTGPVDLVQLKVEDGYLIHPRAVETLFGTDLKPLVREKDAYVVDAKGAPAPAAPTGPLIRKATDVPAAERKGWFWVPDKEVADAWVALHTITPAKSRADK